MADKVILSRAMKVKSKGWHLYLTFFGILKMYFKSKKHLYHWIRLHLCNWFIKKLRHPFFNQCIVCVPVAVSNRGCENTQSHQLWRPFCNLISQGKGSSLSSISTLQGFGAFSWSSLMCLTTLLPVVQYLFSHKVDNYTPTTEWVYYPLFANDFPICLHKMLFSH